VEVHTLFLSYDLTQSACGFSRIRCQASVPFPRQDFFHEPPLPGVQFGFVFAVPRLQPARADFRGGHFTGAWASVVQAGDDSRGVGSGGARARLSSLVTMCKLPASKQEADSIRTRFTLKRSGSYRITQICFGGPSLAFSVPECPPASRNLSFIPGESAAPKIVHTSYCQTSKCDKHLERVAKNHHFLSSNNLRFPIVSVCN
jgi:hypothetical protein